MHLRDIRFITEWEGGNKECLPVLCTLLVPSEKVTASLNTLLVYDFSFCGWLKFFFHVSGCISVTFLCLVYLPGHTHSGALQVRSAHSQPPTFVAMGHWCLFLLCILMSIWPRMWLPADSVVKSKDRDL